MGKWRRFWGQCDDRVVNRRRSDIPDGSGDGYREYRHVYIHPKHRDISRAYSRERAQLHSAVGNVDGKFCNFRRECDAYAYANTDSNSNSNTHADSNPNPNAHTYAYSNSNGFGRCRRQYDGIDI